MFVGHPHTRFDVGLFGEASIQIAAHAHMNDQCLGNGVLQIERDLSVSPRPWKPNSALCGVAQPSLAEGVRSREIDAARSGMKGADALGDGHICSKLRRPPLGRIRQRGISDAGRNPAQHFCVKHGELIVGSVSPSGVFCQQRVLEGRPIFTLWMPFT